jgi:hypothetical protein
VQQAHVKSLSSNPGDISWGRLGRVKIMEKTLEVILEEHRTEVLKEVLELIGGAKWDFERTKHPNSNQTYEGAFIQGMIEAIEVVQSFLDREE